MPLKSLSEREVRALVSLLADDDPKVVHAVWEHLLELGPPALIYLREASEDPNPRTRLRARHIMARIIMEDLETQFQVLSARDDETFSLEEGVFAIARIEYPDLDRATLRQQLDLLASGVQERLESVRTPREIIETINHYLFRELRFNGNNADYYNADNTYINRVLERRTGIAVSLSAVYLLIGERLGLPLKGVGLPGHFLVKYESGEPEIYVDPFNGGKLLTRKDCVQFLTGHGYYTKEEYIGASPSREIIVRMLRNLILIYSKQQDKARVRRLTHYVDILQRKTRSN